MRRLIDILAPLGLLVIIGSYAWQHTGRALPGKPETWLVAGLALMALHLALRFEDVSRRFGRRQMAHGTNAFVLLLVVMGILGAVNYLASRHSKRWDLTENKRYSLSDETKRFLSGLKEDVTLTYFQKKQDMTAAQERMRQYEQASSHVKVAFVDPLASPGKAQELEARGPWPTLVLQRGAKRERITNDSEQDVTNALVKVTRDAKKTVCFAEGEGERDPEDGGDPGYTTAKGVLAKSQYDVQKVALIRDGKVPATCNVLVVAGPQKDLLPLAIDGLRAYVKGGGKLLVMLEPEMKGPLPNLQALLKEWNLQTAHDVVVDVSPVGQMFGTGPLTPLALDYPYHAITKDMRGIATAFHTARTVKAGTPPIDGVTVQNLLQTSRESWAESDLTLKEPVRMDDGVDTAGPVSLGAVATVRVAPAAAPSPAPSPSPADAKAPEGRVVALGDSDFASNALLSFQGNQDFFGNVIAWLAEDADLISIHPKDAADQRMSLTVLQQRDVALFVMLVMPGFFIVLGIAAWWSRRG